MNAALIDLLTRATDGLLYPSETDEPIVPFCWKRGKDDTATAAAVAHSEQRFPIEVIKPDAFFTPLECTEQGEAFELLRMLLEEHLEDLTVVRAGSPVVTIHVIGRTGDDWAGVWTTSVET